MAKSARRDKAEGALDTIAGRVLDAFSKLTGNRPAGALTTGAPLVPVRLFGTAAAFSILPPRIGFSKLRVVVGEPLAVDPQEPSIEAASRLTADLESAIAALTPAALPEP